MCKSLTWVYTQVHWGAHSSTTSWCMKPTPLRPPLVMGKATQICTSSSLEDRHSPGPSTEAIQLSVCVHVALGRGLGLPWSPYIASIPLPWTSTWGWMGGGRRQGFSGSGEEESSSLHRYKGHASKHPHVQVVINTRRQLGLEKHPFIYHKPLKLPTSWELTSSSSSLLSLPSPPLHPEDILWPKGAAEARKDTDVNVKVNQRGLVPVSLCRAERRRASTLSFGRGIREQDQQLSFLIRAV